MPGGDKKQELARIIAGRVSQLKPEKLDNVRSILDQVVGFVTNDTLYRLRQVVADHVNAPAEGAELRIPVILGLCDEYLAGDGTKPENKAKAAEVEDIKAEAMVEWGRRQAEARYLADAYAKNPANPSSATPMGKQTALTVTSAHPGAQALAQGKTSNLDLGAGEAGLALARKYGLTEAEILAVKTYTSDDYKYMNPATANSEGWMAAQQFKDKPEDYLKTDAGQADMRQLMEEGSLQAAMAVAALQKFEPKTGLCFRGDRMTPQEFKNVYGDADNRKLPRQTRVNLTSIARVRHSAEAFANRSDDAAKTVSVMTEVQVKNGREIRDLSVYGRGEEEWLLLPGTVLQTDSVEELPSGTPGSPPATKWYLVKSHEE